MQAGRPDEPSSEFSVVHRWRYAGAGCGPNDEFFVAVENCPEQPVEDDLWDDVSFAWEMVRHVKSNAIVLGKDTSLMVLVLGR